MANVATPTGSTLYSFDDRVAAESEEHMRSSRVAEDARVGPENNYLERMNLDTNYPYPRRSSTSIFDSVKIKRSQSRQESKQPSVITTIYNVYINPTERRAVRAPVSQGKRLMIDYSPVTTNSSTL